jgi:hypothetical protein
MMTKSKWIDKIAKKLEVVISSTAKKLKVTHILQKSNRTIVLFDDDMEIDFDPYFRIEKVIAINK